MLLRDLLIEDFVCSRGYLAVIAKPFPKPVERIEEPEELILSSESSLQESPELLVESEEEEKPSIVFSPPEEETRSPKCTSPKKQDE